MFNTITTSSANRAIITDLTGKFGLGSENIIARLAFAHSIAEGKKMNLKEIQDAKGKAYSARVLFGEHIDFYIAMVCQHYNIYKTHKDIPKYIKMHIDDGIQEMQHYENSDGVDFLITEIENGLLGGQKKFF